MKLLDATFGGNKEVDCTSMITMTMMISSYFPSGKLNIPINYAHRSGSD